MYMHRDIKAWPLDHLCSQDVASALLDFTTEGYSKVLLCSIYWDGRIDTFPEDAIRAMKLANEKGFIFLMGGDFNARNVIYGSKTTDKRGKIFEDILIANNLYTLNVGTIPTCMASSQGSVIDVTAITSGMENVVENWKVSKMNSESDHRFITFDLAVPKIEKKKRTVMNENHKKNFTAEVEGEARNILDNCNSVSTSIGDLEQITDRFVKGVQKAYKTNSRTYEVKIKPKNTLWRDKRVNMQIKARDAAQRKHRRRPDQESGKRLDKENAKLKQINKTVRTQLFRGELDQIVTNDDMAKLAKYAKQGKQKEITMIKDVSGNVASTPEEAVTNLCSAHFPSAKVLTETMRQEKIEVAGKQTNRKNIVYPDYLSIETIRKAINTFGNKNLQG